MSLIDQLGTEKCDGCGKWFSAKDIVYNGQSFLCPTCLELAKKLKDWDKKLEEGFKDGAKRIYERQYNHKTTRRFSILYGNNNVQR